jgi:hypothetical protein
MTFPLSILWDCFGSSDILGYKEMKQPASFQLFTGLLDLNRPSGVYTQDMKTDQLFHAERHLNGSDGQT